MSTHYCEQCNPNWRDQETYGHSTFMPCQKCGTTVNVRYQPGDPLKPVSEEKQMSNTPIVDELLNTAPWRIDELTRELEKQLSEARAALKERERELQQEEEEAEAAMTLLRKRTEERDAARAELERAMRVVEAARQWADGEVNGGLFSLRHEIEEWEDGR